MSKRIALIHALTHSVAPINAEFARQWPAAVLMNLLDDSLSADLARAGSLDADMQRRFHALGDYAVAAGADAMLFTCSAFGPCIDAVAQRHPHILVLKPTEAMIAAACRDHRRIGLVASFAPTLASLPAEFPAHVDLHCELADGALAALARGDGAAHDQAATAAALRLVERGCSVIALAQFSLARALPLVQQAVSVPVLTTVGSAVTALRQRLG